VLVFVRARDIVNPDIFSLVFFENFPNSTSSHFMSFRAAALHSKTFIAGRRTTRMTAAAATTTTTSSGATKKQHTIFFDLDDCLYKNDWKVANLLTERIEKYTVGKLGLKPGYAYELYKKYGTCLKGMMVEKILDEDSVDDYLLWAHDVPLEEHISDVHIHGVGASPRGEMLAAVRNFRFVHRYYRCESG
jgi:hypothetical protein